VKADQRSVVLGGRDTFYHRVVNLVSTLLVSSGGDEYVSSQLYREGRLETIPLLSSIVLAGGHIVYFVSSHQYGM
jgi:hypothetical protein